MARHRRKRKTQAPLHLQVALDRRVLGYVAEELSLSPGAEEGGKYIGYLVSEQSPKLQTLGLDTDRPALVVTDFLPSGPKAVRTAVELQPDGEYQESLFRRAETIDPEIEHLGTWHSHHCNGLPTLSDRDVVGYRRTVNRTAYRPDYFFASLVTRMPRNSNDSTWIDHFLFIRRDDNYYRITESIILVDCPTVFGQLITHPHRVRARHLVHRDTQVRSSPLEERPGSAWHDTQDGRAILAVDRASFASLFPDGVVVTRRGLAVTMTGRMDDTDISMRYPAAAGDLQQVMVTLKQADAAVLTISAGLEKRNVALAAARAAAQELKAASVDVRTER